jgi:scaffold protein FimL
MYSINKQALELVRDELQTEMEQLNFLLEQSSPESVDMEVLVKGLTHIHGVFSFLEMIGGLDIVADILALLPVTDVDKLSDDHWGVVVNAIKLLPSYFQHVQSTEQDNPLLLLPEINELRRSNCQPLRDEYFYMAGLLPDTSIVSLIMSKDAEQLDVIRLSRHLFQKGLISAVRGNGRKAAVKIMAHGIHRLRKAMTDEAEQLYWSMVFEVLGALYRGALGFEQTRLRALMSVERQLKMLTENSPHEKCYPDGQQKAMMAHFSLSGCATESAQKLRSHLDIEPLNFCAKDISGYRAHMVANGGASFHETMLVLSDKHDELSFILDELVINPEQHVENKNKLQEGFGYTSEICLMLGLSQVGQRCAQHTEALQEVVGDEKVADELIDEMVNTLLCLDSIIAELHGQSPSEHKLQQINQKTLTAIIESNVVNHAERRVLQEALVNLSEVMRVSGDYCDGMAEEGIAVNGDNRSVLDNFNAIVGSIDILGLSRASSVAKRCLNYFEKHFSEESEGMPDSMMDVFADAIVSLEYYLDNRRWDPDFDDSVLSVAENCLTRLET